MVESCTGTAIIMIVVNLKLQLLHCRYPHSGKVDTPRVAMQLQFTVSKLLHCGDRLNLTNIAISS